MLVSALQYERMSMPKEYFEKLTLNRFILNFVQMTHELFFYNTIFTLCKL